MPSSAILLGLLPWFGLPLLLIIMVTRLRVVRFAFGTVLVVALTVLFAIFLELLQGKGLPTWAEGLMLWGPTTLVVCGAALLVDRRLSRRQQRRAQPEAEQILRATVGGRRPVRSLAGAFVAWSMVCGCCLISPAVELFDLRLESPTPGLVLPMPRNLTLVSVDRECGSDLCSETYLVGSPDKASPQELAARLWKHLVVSKGWDRLRDDAGCQRPGWFLRHQVCLFVDVERATPAAVLRIHVTGALGVASLRSATR